MHLVALVVLSQFFSPVFGGQPPGPWQPLQDWQPYQGAPTPMRPPPLLSVLPIVTPQQQAAGSLTTASGVTITDSRASNVYCANSSGTLVLLGNNQPCVESSGLRVEGQSTNYFLQTGSPATQTITIPSTGSYTGSIYSGTGSIAWAVGTAVATGLPCTSTTGSSCTFNVTTTGTVTATVSGSVSHPQLEPVAVRTSPIDTTTTAATRAGDQPTPSGITISGAHPSFSLDVTPMATGYQVLMELNNGGADHWALFENGNGTIQCSYWSGTANYGGAYASLTLGVKHHLACAYDGTNVTLTIDGTRYATNVGAVTVLTANFPVDVGYDQTGSSPTLISGWISNVCADGSSSRCQ